FGEKEAVVPIPRRDTIPRHDTAQRNAVGDSAAQSAQIAIV
ncbi:hypothetical protein V491_08476, partial [Pseudogymnoascus sp. VKM F-3775]